jgi:hypothetical protein
LNRLLRAISKKIISSKLNLLELPLENAYFAVSKVRNHRGTLKTTGFRGSLYSEK